MGACSEAVEYLRTRKSLTDAWEHCARADWMLWLLGRLAGPPETASRKALVMCAAACAETALPFIRDEWVAAVATSAIQTAQAYALGEATLEDVRADAAAA